MASEAKPIPNNVNDYSIGKVGHAVTVYGSSRAVPGTPLWDIAEETGRRAAENGMTIYSGGYGGTMEAVSKGAREVIDAGKAPKELFATNVEVHGLLCPGQFPDRMLVGNKWLTQSTDANNMCHRIDLLTSRSRYFVVLPGTMGTMMELSSIWCLWYVHPTQHDRPIIFAFRDPWEQVCNDIAKGLKLPSDQVGAVHFVDRPEEIFEAIAEDRRKHAPEMPPAAPTR